MIFFSSIDFKSLWRCRMWWNIILRKGWGRIENLNFEKWYSCYYWAESIIIQSLLIFKNCWQFNFDDDRLFIPHGYFSFSFKNKIKILCNKKFIRSKLIYLSKKYIDWIVNLINLKIYFWNNDNNKILEI